MHMPKRRLDQDTSPPVRQTAWQRVATEGRRMRRLQVLSYALGHHLGWRVETVRSDAGAVQARTQDLDVDGDLLDPDPLDRPWLVPVHTSFCHWPGIHTSFCH